VGKGWLKERCGLESRTNFFSFKKSPKTGCGLDSRIYGKFQVIVAVSLCDRNLRGGTKVMYVVSLFYLFIYFVCYTVKCHYSKIQNTECSRNI
jgi:hypothetical protein